MCGIAGISMRSRVPMPEGVLDRLSRQLTHRGPDSDGVYRHGNTGIVHRRLSIIDLEGGQQPIGDAERQVHIIVNGEIYNYLDLRRQLEAEGTTFSSASDSEIPLHLYKKYGLECVRYLKGMYALALYDSRTNDLILARDPVGIKPLYMCQTEDGIAFASEPAAITRSGWHKAGLNMDALPCYINRQFVAGRETLFQGIERVLPGEVLRIRDGVIIERMHFPPALHTAGHMGEEEATEAFDDVFARAVKTHLQSEVPYGTFLSGGIDSSAVVSRMAELAGSVRTYTVGFESLCSSDERSQAEHLAEALGTQHKTVEFTEADFWHYLPDFCRVMDDLAADYNAIPTLKLAEHAKGEVKIILSGEGGDEIFAGYGRYRRPNWIQRLLGYSFRGRGDAVRFGHLFREPKRFARYYKTEAKDNTYRAHGFSHLQTCQARDIAEWLPNNLLLRLDRCLMANSIEGRVPLLDYDMLMFAFALPDHLKLRGRQGKWLLKHWLGARHPDLQVWAPKRGFAIPLHEWLEKKREKLIPYILEHPLLATLLVPEKTRAWLNQPLDAKGAKLLCNFLCLALWHDIHIAGKPAEIPL